jgi:hypothetical protein
VLPGDGAALAEQRVRDYMQAGQLTGYDTAPVSVDSSATIPLGGDTVSASVVTVSYPFSFVVLNPVASLVVPGSTLGAPITITASAAMRNESPF